LRKITRKGDYGEKTSRRLYVTLGRPTQRRSEEKHSTMTTGHNLDDLLERRGDFPKGPKGPLRVKGGGRLSEGGYRAA